MTEATPDGATVYLHPTRSRAESAYTRVGYGGGSGPMEPTVPIKDYVDARDDAVESRLMAKLDAIPTTTAMRSTIWGAVATALGIVFAVLAFGGDRFDGGASVSPIVSQIQGQQAKRDDAQDAKLQEIDQKLDVLIERSTAK